MKKIIIAIPLIICGCATSKTTHLPDGSIGHSINCSGTGMSWGNCEEKAGEICKAQGYTVISKNGDTGATISSNQYGTYGGTVINRSMLIKCRSN